MFCVASHPSIDIGASTSWLLLIMMLRTWVRISLRDPIFHRWIAGPYGNSVFNFLRNCHTVFHNGYSHVHFYQWYSRVPLFPHPCQHPCCFLDFAVVVVIFRFCGHSHNNGYEVVQVFLLYVICRYFFPVCDLPLYSLNGVWVEVLDFHEVCNSFTSYPTNFYVINIANIFSHTFLNFGLYI